MNSFELTNNLKYNGKIIAIFIVIVIILHFIMNQKLKETLLLALVIAVSILTIEKFINFYYT